MNSGISVRFVCLTLERYITEVRLTVPVFHCLTSLNATRKLGTKKMQKHMRRIQKTSAHELVNMDHLCVHRRAYTHTDMHAFPSMTAWHAPGGHCQSSASLQRRVRVHYAVNPTTSKLHRQIVVKKYEFNYSSKIVVNFTNVCIIISIMLQMLVVMLGKFG